MKTLNSIPEKFFTLVRLIVLLLFLLTGKVALSDEITDNQKRVFKHYAIAALFEICVHSVIHKCTALEYRLDTGELEPEIYLYKDQEVMVLYRLAERLYPSVVLKYNKDRILEVYNRGVWLADKQGMQEIIDSFIESGGQIVDENYYD